METTDRSAEHAAVCKELTELYARKNHDYGDSFHITFQKWGPTMSAIRLEDKLQRFEKLIRSDSEVKNESIRDTLIDLANYAIMTVMELDRLYKIAEEKKQYYKEHPEEIERLRQWQKGYEHGKRSKEEKDGIHENP